MKPNTPAHRIPGPRFAKVNRVTLFACPHDHGKVDHAARCKIVKDENAVIVSIWCGRAHVLSMTDGKWVCQCVYRSAGCNEVEAA